MALGIGSFLRTLALLVATVSLTAIATRDLMSCWAQRSSGLGILFEAGAATTLFLVGSWLSIVLAAVLIAFVTGNLGRLPCPRSWRPVIALCCGLGAAFVIAAPGATASTPTDTRAGHLPSLARPESATIPVTAGDSLWTIVSARHPHDPAATIARRVRQLHLANLAVIGDDADLIHPGQQLIADDHDPRASQEHR